MGCLLPALLKMDTNLIKASERSGCRGIGRREQLIFVVELKWKGRYVKEYSKTVSDSSSYRGADLGPISQRQGVEGGSSVREKEVEGWLESFRKNPKFTSTDLHYQQIACKTWFKGFKLFLSFKNKVSKLTCDSTTLKHWGFFLAQFKVKKRKNPSGCGHVCQPSARSKVLQLTYKPLRDRVF